MLVIFLQEKMYLKKEKEKERKKERNDDILKD